MRWIWIDKFVEFIPRERATSIKNVSLAEEHLHDLFPDFPIFPNTLIIEAMAQTAGILVGEAGKFAEKVILAKITRATFHRLVRPGDTLRLEAKIDQLSSEGASCSGVVTVDGAADPGTQSSGRAANLVADIELMFSHIDQNLAGSQFPAENFVFTGDFMRILESRMHQAPIRP